MLLAAVRAMVSSAAVTAVLPLKTIAVGAEIVSVGATVYPTPLFANLICVTSPMLVFTKALAEAATVLPAPPVTVTVALAV